MMAIEIEQCEPGDLIEFLASGCYGLVFSNDQRDDVNNDRDKNGSIQVLVVLDGRKSRIIYAFRRWKVTLVRKHDGH